MSWSKKVWDTSDALGFRGGLFKLSAREIADGLAKAARERHQHPGTPGKKRSTARSDLQSAMSMLNYYVNRAGTNLSEERRQTLELAKVYLREAFER